MVGKGIAALLGWVSGKQTGWEKNPRGDWSEADYPDLWEQGPEKSHAHSWCLLGLWATDTLCPLNRWPFGPPGKEYVALNSLGPFSSLLLILTLLGHGPKHWGSDPPSRE